MVDASLVIFMEISRHSQCKESVSGLGTSELRLSFSRWCCSLGFIIVFTLQLNMKQLAGNFRKHFFIRKGQCALSRLEGELLEQAEEILRGLVHMWWEHRDEMDRRHVVPWTIMQTLYQTYDEEGAKPKIKALNLPVCLHSNLQPRPEWLDCRYCTCSWNAFLQETGLNFLFMTDQPNR